MSVIFNCGFARVAVKESFRKVGSASVETNPSEKWKNYLAAFEGDSQEVFAVERSTYVKKSKAIYSAEDIFHNLFPNRETFKTRKLLRGPY